MDHLEAPHIRLGFYWHEIPEAAAYRMVLRWLVDRGYEMSPRVTVMRSSGALPRFTQLAAHGLPEGECTTFDDWSVDQALARSDWLPVLVRLVPGEGRSVSLDLGYATMGRESFRSGEAHAVEITASGMDLNLVENIRAGNAPGTKLSPKLAKKARLIDCWQKRTFRGICDDLCPDYAARRWEWSLQPPKSLIASLDVRDFGNLYIAPGIADPEEIRAALSGLRAWGLERFDKGVFLSLRDMSDPRACTGGVETIRSALRSRF